MPVRMDAQEGYRPLPLVVKASAPLQGYQPAGGPQSGQAHACLAGQRAAARHL